MVGIFGSGSYFICWWKRACSGEDACGEGLDLHSSMLQSHPRYIVTYAAAKARSGSERLLR